MSNYDENAVCDCIVCEGVEEFRQLMKDKVDWESGLRHVLHGVIKQSQVEDDALLSDAIEEAYMDGYVDGMETGVDKAHSLMLALVEDTDARVEAYRDGSLEDLDAETETEEIEDLTDEQFDEIQKIINQDL